MTTPPAPVTQRMHDNSRTGWNTDTRNFSRQTTNTSKRNKTSEIRTQDSRQTEAELQRNLQCAVLLSSRRLFYVFKVVFARDASAASDSTLDRTTAGKW